jgi:hypothetical protein
MVPDLPDDPLQLTVCPECGYALRGLPAKSTCPECGFEYDQSVVVLYGWPTGHRAYITLSRAEISIVLLVVATFACAALLVLSGGAAVPVIAIGGTWLGLLVVLVRRWARAREPESPSAPHQLRFSRRGFAQRHGFGPVKIQPWYRRSHLESLARRGTTSGGRKNREPGTQNGLVYIRDLAIPGRDVSERQYHICVPWSAFMDYGYYGRDCVDIVVDLRPNVLERVRQRLQAWQVLASPELTDQFWVEYKVPSSAD